MVVAECNKQKKMMKSSTKGDVPSECEEHIKVKGRKSDRGAARYEQLIEYHSLPGFLRDNEFILGYYRSEWPLKHALLSIFTVHNETLNVWTHLIGFFLFLALTIYTASKVPGSVVDLHSLEKAGVLPDFVNMKSSAITRWPFYAFMGGAMFCLLASSACHLLCCHSERVSYIMLRLDYAGIAALIATSFYPPVYYSFLCSPSFLRLYLTLITLLGIATIMVSLLPVFQSPGFRGTRAGLFFGMGLSGAGPVLHKLLLHWDRPEALETTAYELLMGALYGLGALIYTLRIPERWNPGKFDIAGHSHQLFHVLVVAGAYTHYCNALVYLKWRDVHAC